MKLPKKDINQQCFYEDSASGQPIQDQIQQKSEQAKTTKMIRKAKDHRDNQSHPLPIKIAQNNHGAQEIEMPHLNYRKWKPKNNEQENPHQLISQKFNHIYQHYGRLLIYFYLMKKQNNQGLHSFSLQVHQNRWINEASNIMNIDNFPTNINQRNHTFLLHPNSLHFIFQFNKANKVIRYSTQQIKFYLFAFLAKKGLLTSSTHNYICRYWSDIIYLLNEWTCQQNRVRKELKGKQLYVEYEQEVEEASMTRQDFQKQLKTDSSIAAYELACYLKCCCEYFGIHISTPRKE